jgi:signal transduction histidine kinase/CheY-like chemotaxis protein
MFTSFIAGGLLSLMLTCGDGTPPFMRNDSLPEVISLVLPIRMLRWVALLALLVSSFLHLYRRTMEYSRLAQSEITSVDKQNLLARLSHELRTPLAGIVGLLDVLESECVGREQKLHVSLLQKTCNDMMQLLDGILQLAKTGAGKSHVESLPFDLHREMEVATSNLRLILAPRGIQVLLTYDKDLGDEFVGDRRLIRQVINNLLSNASKFTDQGCIEVVVNGKEDVGGHQTTVHFRVIDTGTGITESRREAVFEEFEQADLGIRSLHGGSELGLSIVRSLCRMMGGEVQIESTSSKGTTFHFWVRLGVRFTDSADMATPWSPSIGPNSLQGLHILVAEDTRLLSKLIKRLLENEGGICTMTEDGQQAVDMYSSNPKLFDVILLDLIMPVLTGYEATEKIRALEKSELSPHIPIIAVTAHAFERDRLKCLEAGMDEYVRSRSIGPSS